MILSRLYQNYRLEVLIDQLQAAGFETGNLELSEAAGLHFANLYRKSPSNIISRDVFCGCSPSQPVAVAKALVECIEREAFQAGRAAGLSSCQTEKSEGFAGYPSALGLRRIAIRRCRHNALSEAVERYAWATWWDDETTSYRCRNVDELGTQGREVLALLQSLSTHSPIRSVKVIEPDISPPGIKLRILLAEFENGGFTTGGAAGAATHRGLRKTNHRAAAELARHTLALSRMDESRVEPTTDYEAKLAFFGFGQGTDLVRSRLATNGTKPIRLPALVCDEEIPHQYSRQVVVYRCLFEGQPPFVSGPIGRLCI